MTNRRRHHRFVLQQLLPAWGLTHVATWFWLKVTQQGEPVTPLASRHRHPFEQLWLARPAGVPAGDSATAAALPPPPDRLVLASVPGAHSRKPHLAQLLAPHACAAAGNAAAVPPVAVELFARQLFAGWMSWGNEALKFQQLAHWTPRAAAPEAAAGAASGGGCGCS